MNAFERMNRLMDLIDTDLTADLSGVDISRMMECPQEQFGRIFSFLTGMPLSEYVRRRRLTVSAFEIQQSSGRIIDTAVKYGYDSQAAFARAFKEFHGLTPTEANNKSAVFQVQNKLVFSSHDFMVKNGEEMAILGKVDFLELPAARMIGMEVVNGGGNNPVPALWEAIFSQNKLAALHPAQALLELYVGWMGEYEPADQTFTYIAGYLMPAGTGVPDGFTYRDIPACRIGLGTINGDFANGGVFAHSHKMTVEGITKAGYEPDYSFGWSAEAYPKDLSFEASEGTIHYICPCKP
ncbi:MAG: hypothetical protein K0Q90_3080 [Paenibacillaceae bacterium]|jgi:AraC family transcriptional regulator|nr:hypothetical protein [Paenibacillaceae bacterium]